MGLYISVITVLQETYMFYRRLLFRLQDQKNYRMAQISAAAKVIS